MLGYAVTQAVWLKIVTEKEQVPPTGSRSQRREHELLEKFTRAEKLQENGKYQENLDPITQVV